MKGYPCPYLSTIQGEFLEPQPSSKPTVASGFELHPGYIALVGEQPFSGAEDEDPYDHLQEFEELYGYPRHNTGNLEVEVVSFLSHREGGAMVHPQHGKYDW
jgi:hypothetical protein